MEFCFGITDNDAATHLQCTHTTLSHKMHWHCINLPGVPQQPSNISVSRDSIHCFVMLFQKKLWAESAHYLHYRFGTPSYLLRLGKLFLISEWEINIMSRWMWRRKFENWLEISSFMSRQTSLWKTEPQPVLLVTWVYFKPKYPKYKTSLNSLIQIHLFKIIYFKMFWSKNSNTGTFYIFMEIAN